MKTEQITGAIEKLFEGSDIENVRDLVRSLDLGAPAEINEAARDYFTGPIGDKATHEMGQRVAEILSKIYKLPEVNSDINNLFAVAYAAHRMLSADNGPLTVGEVFIAFCAYQMASMSYRSRIVHYFGFDGLLKLDTGSDSNE